MVVKHLICLDVIDRGFVQSASKLLFFFFLFQMFCMGSFPDVCMFIKSSRFGKHSIRHVSSNLNKCIFCEQQSNVFTAFPHKGEKTPGGHSQDLMHAWQHKSLSSLLLPLNSVKKLLTDALNKNQYLKRLELQQIKDMVECMYERTYQQGEYVIKQGEPGNHLFVLAGRSGRV